MITLSLLFIFLSGVFDAVMDTVDHHFYESVFSRIPSMKKRLWFCELEGWRNKYVNRTVEFGRVKWSVLGYQFNKPVQLCDAWHFFKMLREFAACAAPIPLLYASVENPYWLLLFVAYGCVRNTGFSLFYNKLLLLPEHRRRWLIF